MPVEITNPHLFVSKPKTAFDSSESLAIAVASNSNKTAATTQAALIFNVRAQQIADSQAAGLTSLWSRIAEGRSNIGFRKSKVEQALRASGLHASV